MKYVLFLLFSLHVILFAADMSVQLEKNYTVSSYEVKLSDIIQSPKNDEILFNINPQKHTKRVQRKVLIKLLEQCGYKATSKYRYIQFNKKSDVDFEPLKKELVTYFQNHYTDFTPLHVEVQTRTYINKLPENYALKFRSKSYLFPKGVVRLHSTHKDIFLNYTIDAKVPVAVAKTTLHKGEKIDGFGVKIANINFERFKAMPLQSLTPHLYEAKHTIKAGDIITLRDIDKSYLVKRGENVSVDLINGGIVINFSAKAKQNGRVSDIITIEKNDGKKLKAVVKGKNRVEVR